MTITSNLDKVIKDLQMTLKSEVEDKLISEVAQHIYDASVKRIFTDGMNVNLTPIGGYSRYTKVLRRKKGLEVAVVNLTDSGGLKNSYRLAKIADGHYAIGFSTSKYAALAAKNEKKFGCKIFGLTKADNKLTKKVIQEYLKKLKLENAGT